MILRIDDIIASKGGGGSGMPPSSGMDDYETVLPFFFF
jgi:hypothetical protein